MKAAAFDYARARSTAHAVELLAERPDGRLIAGGQSLGPMLNLRLARPGRLIDIRECDDLRRFMDTSDGVVYGAAITHGEIEDGDVPDPSPGWLRRAARNIAYRAIRNRGTIGGSLAHADPAADWPVVLAALGAEVWIEGPAGPRADPLHSFICGPFATTLGEGEVLTAVRVPRPSPSARLGYCKLSAKRGEFAQALAVVFEDPERGTNRAVVGAIERAPLVVDRKSSFSGDVRGARALLAAWLPAGTGGPIHAAALARAARDARAARGADFSGGRPESAEATRVRAWPSDRTRSDPGASGPARRNGRSGTITESMAAESSRTRIRLTVNGRPVEAKVAPRTHLADFLRERLHLTGTHLGCEHGVCGACTVLIDGVPARSCIAFAAASHGADVRTIEGFADDRLMNALRDAFSGRHALQCGYCTPGMLVTAWDLARRLPGADEPQVRTELAGNLCRCTGYQGIVEAIGDVLSGGEVREASCIPLPALPVPARLERPRAVRSAGTPPAPPASASAAASGVGGARGSDPADSEITWRTRVDASPERLWEVLHDVPRVVEALPGAELAGPPEERPLRLRLVTAIGPMRSSFDGEAEVSWDDDTRSGRIEGRAEDEASRSSGEGRVRFRAVEAPDGAGGAALELAVRYRIRGPLAQFSRGPVLDAVMEQLLARFASNLEAAAAGKAIGDAPPPGGLRLLLAAAGSTIRRWLKP